VEERALPVAPERWEPAALIAARGLDLDDVRTEVGQRQPAERPGDQRRELDDPYSLEEAQAA
jgi:hypothetical protein